MNEKKETDILEIFGTQLDPEQIEALKIRRKIMLDAEKLELESTDMEYLPNPKIGTPILLMTKRVYKTRHMYKKYRACQFMRISGLSDSDYAECTYAGSYYYKDGTDCSELSEDIALMIYFIHEFQHGIEVEWRNTDLFPEDMVKL